jgi:Flp pilus assembly pilin Flp
MLIALVAITAVQVFGANLSTEFSQIASSIENT